MIDNPSFLTLVMQGLITAVLLLTPLYAVVLGGKLRTTSGDLALAAAAYPMATVVTFMVFAPFEGKWADADYSVVEALRTLLVGALVLALGMAITQWKSLSRRPLTEVGVRVGAAASAGAFWGVIWVFAGWFLYLIGVGSYG